MKSLLPLVRVVLVELGRRCGIDTSRDFETVAARFESEGLSFITITLADFGKDFDEALDLGSVSPTSFAGFTKRGHLPKFLGGMMGLVFESSTGNLRERPNITAIRSIRQFTLMWAKIRMECTNARTSAAFEAFVRTEHDVRVADRHRSPGFVLDYRGMATRLWGQLLADVDADVYHGRILPKHGPGATADRLRGNAKFTNRTWTDRLERVFPYFEYAAADWHAAVRLDHEVVHLAEQAEIPVRVIAVPKTLKTPRIIAIEPTHMQFMQQGILESIVNHMQSDKIANAFVNFVGTQGVNQKLAAEGSATGRLATLDLSEASDRVSNQLVRALLQNHPHLSEAVDACRSRSADVPGHGVKRLAKFASMGSALTFPMEAIVFCTLVFMAIEGDVGHRLSPADIMSYRGKVRVYGDDIIVPVEHVPSVIGILEAQGLKVNRRKSFWSGKFRESCGEDYFDGNNVSLTRLRSLLPQERTDVSELVSTVSFRNQLWKAGYWETVEYLDERVKVVIPFPFVSENSPALGRWTDGVLDIHRYNKRLQRSEVRAVVARAKIPENEISGYDALLKMYLNRSQQPTEDPMHLIRSGRPHDVSTNREWIPVH